MSFVLQGRTLIYETDNEGFLMPKLLYIEEVVL
jgi:hypothetical protein